MPVLPRRDAHRRLHHAGIGDRSDPRAPSHPRLARGPRRPAEPPIDAGPRERGCVTRPARPRRRSAGPLSTAPRPDNARGRSACAAVPPRRHIGPPRPPPPARTSDLTAREGHRRGVGRAEARSPVLARRGTTAYTRPTPIEFPILTGTYGGTERQTGKPTQGGYSRDIVVDERFVLRIPDGMELVAAAPLLCAGITTFSPLRGDSHAHQRTRRRTSAKHLARRSVVGVHEQ